MSNSQEMQQKDNEIRTPQYNLLIGKRKKVNGENYIEVGRGSRSECIPIEVFINLLKLRT